MSTEPTKITREIHNYLEENFSHDDDFLKKLIKRSEELGFPQIHISPLQSGFLQMMIKTINAKKVLEIGSLAGYSAISMAKAMPDDGELIAVEINPKYASFIRERVSEVGLENIIKVENIHALDYLEDLDRHTEYDLVFIDADKKNYLNYAKKVTPFVRKRGVLIADNALGFGHIVDKDPERANEVKPIRDFNKWFSDNPEFFTSFVTIGDGLIIGVKQ